MKREIRKALTLDPANLTGVIDISSSLGFEDYIDEDTYYVSFICSDNTAVSTITTQFEPLEKIIVGLDISYKKEPNDDRLIYVGDDILSSNTKLIGGKGSIKLKWRACKRFQFTANNLPNDSTLTISIN